MITGVAGFCGRHLACRLRREEELRVVGLDLAAEAPPGVPIDAYVPADVASSEAVAGAVRQVRPDFVYHLAGLIQGSLADLYRVNLLGGVHLLDAVRANVPEARILIVGSAAEYGCGVTSMPITEDQVCRPSGPYAMSKYSLTCAALDYVRDFRMRVVVARPFNIVGAGVPETLVVGAVLRRARDALLSRGDAVVSVGNLETQRDFIAVEDAVDGYVRMLRGNSWGGVFNVCSGEARTIRSVIERLLSFAPRPVRFHVDPSLLRSTDAPVVFGNCERARHAFGFQPSSSLDEALHAAWCYAMGGNNKCV